MKTSRRIAVAVSSFVGVLCLAQLFSDVWLASFFKSGTKFEGSFRSISIGMSRTDLAKIHLDSHNRLKLVGFEGHRGETCWIGLDKSECGLMQDSEAYIFSYSAWFDEMVTVKISKDAVSEIAFRRHIAYLDL